MTSANSAPVSERSATADEVFGQAMLHANQGRSEAAVPLFQRALVLARASGTGDRRVGTIASALARALEQVRDYEAARQAHQEALECFRSHGERGSAAVEINNLAFTYTFEQRWREAMPGFLEACQMQAELGNLVEAANAADNWAACMVELGEIAQAEPALQAGLLIMSQARDWRERKPRHYLARILAGRGEISAAIAHQVRAVAIGETMNSMYLHTDRAYLAELRARMSE